ncbi:basic blue protein-like [Musa acuminata AAA Group]|uniref:basic blue protein-like n=1 Tax=Musa acuminata AAA Group TaxID=214697 RepID=UPI0031D12716
MAQGRGSAGGQVTVVLWAAVLCLLLAQVAEAATYTVGDTRGWSFNMDSWPRGKRFRAGDVLVFKYNPLVHNVVAVNAAGYNGCSTPRGSRVLTSGKDRVTLARGRNYFICNSVGHCQSGMKMAIVAA